MINKIAITVSGLWRYPVKSMIGEELNTSFKYSH